MLSSWGVLEYVAARHGKLEEVFNRSQTNLEKVREGLMPMIDLEENQDRVQKRLARENQPSTVALERIIGTANFQDKYVLDKLSDKAKAVCRILRRGNPIGTGFLVSPNVIITNHHVIESADQSDELLAEFNYELDINQLPKRTACFKTNSSKFFLTSTLKKDEADPFSGLDFTFIGIENIGTNGEQLDQFGPVYLDGNQGKIIKGESCVIIQHPNGLPKKVVLKDNAFFAETNTCLIYESDTLPGSSGAMVVALGTGEIIALHHSGLPRTDEQNRPLTKSGTVALPGTPDDQIDWLGNEGIKISKIIEALQHAQLPQQMQNHRDELLNKSKSMASNLANIKQLSEDAPGKTGPTHTSVPTTPVTIPIKKLSSIMNKGALTNTDFLITATNTPEVIQRIELILSNLFNQPIQLSLSMPSIADAGAIELFTFSAATNGDNNEQALNLLKIPEIYNAEVDTPLRLNADTTLLATGTSGPATESVLEPDDGLGKWDEEEFLRDYVKSQYVDAAQLKSCRKWNWAATGFDKLLAGGSTPSPSKEGIRIVQFDTGYTDHSKVAGGFDLDHDFNFINSTDVAADPKTIGLGKQPGHGTRTGSLLIGNGGLLNDHDGNIGLLHHDKYKLVPYRIAESVILVNRQQQLASALDTAVSQGFDIITMSMGLPPTIATAKMAKKAYDKGVIWCCAAGNEVQAVISPAVFPGTIAVAASNPLDKIWKASSRGDTVDITAPGEDVYVPIWNKDRKEDFAYGNGTSYATPHIAAAAAYWLAKYRVQLNKPEYAGWKRVEAFRQALKKSARRPEGFPNNVGAGILDAEKLMNTAPLPAQELKYAYNGWNEQAFFATVQGYGQLLKTYWNGLHGWLTGKNKNVESFTLAGSELSPTSLLLEQSLFPLQGSTYESVQDQSAESLLERYQKVQSLVEQAGKADGGASREKSR